MREEQTETWESRLLHGLSQLRPARAVILAVGLVALIGFIDRLTGHDYALGIFYVLPIVVMTAGVNALGGAIATIASTVVWAVADLGTDHRPPGSALYWNTFVRLLFFLLIMWLVSALQRELRRAELRSRTDPLTGLLNLRAFVGHANRELARMRRTGRPITLAYVDIDNFKQINDRFGHGAGDDVLRQVAAVLHDHSRVADVVARLGGDEFVFLYPETAAHEASARAACCSTGSRAT